MQCRLWMLLYSQVPVECPSCFKLNDVTMSFIVVCCVTTCVVCVQHRRYSAANIPLNSPTVGAPHAPCISISPLSTQLQQVLASIQSIQIIYTKKGCDQIRFIHSTL